MTDITTQNEVLKDCFGAFQRMRTNMLAAASHLHHVKETKAWEGRFSSWKEFCEDGLKISDAQASKMLIVFRTFILDAGVEQEKLEEVELEKAYMAIPLLPMYTGQADYRFQVETLLENIKLLSRSDVKEMLTEAKHAAHEHRWSELHLRQCEICARKEKI